MVAGSRTSNNSRQSGRHNAVKDQKSNRKPNKKTNAEIIKSDKEMKSAQNGEFSGTHEMPIPVKSFRKRVLKDADSIPVEEKVALERPKEKPGWFLQNMAFTPSKSYSNKKDEDKSDGVPNL